MASYSCLLLGGQAKFHRSSLTSHSAPVTAVGCLTSREHTSPAHAACGTATIYSLRGAFRSHGIGSRERPAASAGWLARAASSSSGARGPRVRISVDITISIFFRRLYVTCFIGRINSHRILATKISLNYSRNGFAGSGGSSSVKCWGDRIGRTRGISASAVTGRQEGKILSRWSRQYFRINRSFMRRLMRIYETAVTYIIYLTTHISDKSRGMAVNGDGILIAGILQRLTCSSIRA